LAPVVRSSRAICSTSPTSADSLARLARHRSLDVLRNNAGGTFLAKALTPEGIEYTFALNAVAPYALTAALLPPLRAGAGRVVNVVTRVSARTRLEIDGLPDPPRYNAFAAYSRAKLALMALTLEQAARYAEAGITPVAVHPGDRVRHPLR
jgi:retinol dehydrogenase 14